MGCGASAAATGSVPADGAVTVDRASLPPQLPRGCGISDWQQRQPTCVGRIQSALASIQQCNDELHACIEVQKMGKTFARYVLRRKVDQQTELGWNDW